MSVEATNAVWKQSKHKGGTLHLLLAIADNAEGETGTAYPGIAYLASKTRMSTRAIYYNLDALASSGELLIRPGEGPNGSDLLAIRLGPFEHAKIAPHDCAKIAKSRAKIAQDRAKIAKPS